MPSEPKPDPLTYFTDDRERLKALQSRYRHYQWLTIFIGLLFLTLVNPQYLSHVIEGLLALLTRITSELGTPKETLQNRPVSCNAA